jgi:hypothetical protein
MLDLTSPPAEEEPRLGVLDLGGLSAQPRPTRGAQDIGRLTLHTRRLRWRGVWLNDPETRSEAQVWSGGGASVIPTLHYRVR